jgi:integrase
MFRHTFSHDLERSGTPLLTISKLLGHESIVATANYLTGLTNHAAIEELQGVELPPLAA